MRFSLVLFVALLASVMSAVTPTMRRAVADPSFCHVPQTVTLDVTDLPDTYLLSSFDLCDVTPDSVEFYTYHSGFGRIVAKFGIDNLGCNTSCDAKATFNSDSHPDTISLTGTAVVSTLDPNAVSISVEPRTLFLKTGSRFVLRVDAGFFDFSGLDATLQGQPLELVSYGNSVAEYQLTTDTFNTNDDMTFKLGFKTGDFPTTVMLRSLPFAQYYFEKAGTPYIQAAMPPLVPSGQQTIAFSGSFGADPKIMGNNYFAAPVEIPHTVVGQTLLVQTADVAKYENITLNNGDGVVSVPQIAAIATPVTFAPSLCAIGRTCLIRVDTVLPKIPMKLQTGDGDTMDYTQYEVDEKTYLQFNPSDVMSTTDFSFTAWGIPMYILSNIATQAIQTGISNVVPNILAVDTKFQLFGTGLEGVGPQMDLVLRSNENAKNLVTVTVTRVTENGLTYLEGQVHPSDCLYAYTCSPQMTITNTDFALVVPLAFAPQPDTGYRFYFETSVTDIQKGVYLQNVISALQQVAAEDSAVFAIIKTDASLHGTELDFLLTFATEDAYNKVIAALSDNTSALYKTVKATKFYQGGNSMMYCAQLRMFRQDCERPDPDHFDPPSPNHKKKNNHVGVYLLLIGSTVLVVIAAVAYYLRKRNNSAQLGLDSREELLLPRDSSYTM